MQEKRVRDLLLRLQDLPWIEPQSPIRRAVAQLGRLQRQGKTALLLVVRREQREILGTLSPGDILGRIEPPSFSGEGVPIFWQGQFQDQAGSLLERPVAEAMSPLVHALNQNSTLMEALHLMNSKGAHLLIAMQGEEVAGLILREHLYQALWELA